MNSQVNFENLPSQLEKSPLALTPLYAKLSNADIAHLAQTSIAWHKATQPELESRLQKRIGFLISHPNLQELRTSLATCRNPNFCYDECDDFLLTPLHGAIFYGAPEAMKIILQTPGIDVNYLIDVWGTALYMAVYWAPDELMQLLLNADANPNIPTKKGVYPLQLAAENGSYAKVLLLLQRGANPFTVQGTSFVTNAGYIKQYSHAVIDILDKYKQLWRMNECKLATINP